MDYDKFFSSLIWFTIRSIFIALCIWFCLGLAAFWWFATSPIGSFIIKTFSWVTTEGFAIVGVTIAAILLVTVALGVNGLIMKIAYGHPVTLADRRNSRIRAAIAGAVIPVIVVILGGTFSWQDTLLGVGWWALTALFLAFYLHRSAANVVVSPTGRPTVLDMPSTRDTLPPTASRDALPSSHEENR